VENNEVRCAVSKEDDKKTRSLWGTFSSLVGNMIEGVSNGFKKQLEVNGVGYRVSMKGSDLELNLGFSHPILFKAVPGITFTVEKNLITIEGVDKQVVGEATAQIRSLRKPEPYKGKGIKYIDEVIRRKVGKTSAK
jgi:large subunit ribosomal protein L6